VSEHRSINSLRAERDWLRLCVASLDGEQPLPPARPAMRDVRPEVIAALQDGPLSAGQLWRRVALRPQEREGVLRRLRLDARVRLYRRHHDGTPRYALVAAREHT
jgi:hypothetical protein